MQNDFMDSPEIMAIVEQAMAEEKGIAERGDILERGTRSRKKGGSKRNDPPEDAEDRANERKLAEKLPSVMATVVISSPPATTEEQTRKLIGLINDGEQPRHIYDQIILEIAQEADHLKTLREAAQQANVPYNKISRDRVAALKELSDIMAAKARDEMLKGASKGSAEINFHTPEFKRVMKYIIDQIVASANAASIPNHLINMFISNFQQRMNGFENKATELYTGSATSADKARARFNDGREV